MARRLVFLVLLTAACAGLAQDSRLLGTSTSPDAVTLRPGTTEVKLAAVQDEARRLAQPSLAARLKAVVPGKQIYLNLANISAQEQPGVTYNLYLNLPPNRTPTGPADPYFVGTFSFYNAVSGRSFDVAVNITSAVARLLQSGELGDDSWISIVPAGKPNPAAAPQIGKVLITVR